ncbi:MAG: DUF5777 family beta-barrel protein [Bacteroidota bacterium]|nr:DUF5777 family beta-barrel protein [Bacteroidota bacterium]
MFYFLRSILAASVLCLSFSALSAQGDSLLSDLENEQEQGTDYTSATFKSTRIINAHTIENVPGGVLDFRISHRFGTLNSGAYNFYGLDDAYMRMAFEYGITDWLMTGVGRSSNKFFDGFIKLKLLRQSSGQRNMRITLSYFASTAINALKWEDMGVGGRENYFSSRLYYTHQLILGRKFSPGFSFQLMPTVVHRNLVKTRMDDNNVFAIGAAGRYKLTRSLALTGEYFYLLPGETAGNTTNSASIGLDIETGGHVFSLHFSNSLSMIEKGFVTETTGNWLDGGIHFGFNISRVFTIGGKSKEEKAPEGNEMW